MTIYIVRNERNEEVSAFTDQYRAEHLAELLQSDSFRRYTVEELCGTSESEPDLGW